MDVTAKHIWSVGEAFRKRSDLVAQEIKAWIVEHDLRPGDRLPQERELIAHFGVSRGTAREALKALEVQGLIRITTGPVGGPVLVEVPEERAMDLLGSYFYFRTPTAADIYQVRCILEPDMAMATVGHITEEVFAELESLLERSEKQPRNTEDRRRQRNLELGFHDAIASACPNAWLAFTCRFMNKMLADLMVFRRVYLKPLKKFAASNVCAHHELLEAFRMEDRERVRSVMRSHMLEAAEHMRVLDGAIDRAPLLQGT